MICFEFLVRIHQRCMTRLRNYFNQNIEKKEIVNDQRFTSVYICDDCYPYIWTEFIIPSRHNSKAYLYHAFNLKYLKKAKTADCFIFRISFGSHFVFGLIFNRFISSKAIMHLIRKGPLWVIENFKNPKQVLMDNPLLIFVVCRYRFLLSILNTH